MPRLSHSARVVLTFIQGGGRVRRTSAKRTAICDGVLFGGNPISKLQRCGYLNSDGESLTSKGKRKVTNLILSTHLPRLSKKGLRKVKKWERPPTKSSLLDAQRAIFE